MVRRKMRHRIVVLLAGLGIAAIFGLMASEVMAVTDSQPLDINATVSSRAKLTLGVAVINFVDADPDVTPSIAATENPVAVTAKVRTATGSTPTLTVIAADDLISGADTILIGNVTWTAAAAPFIAGTMNKTVAQSAATFAGGSGNYSSSYSYFLANSWAYETGAYSASTTYTLTAP